MRAAKVVCGPQIPYLCVCACVRICPTCCHVYMSVCVCSVSPDAYYFLAITKNLETLEAQLIC